MNAAFSAWVEPARRSAQLWRLLAGAVVILAVHLAWLLAIRWGLVQLAGWAGADGPADPMQHMRQGREPGSMLILLGTYAGLAFGAILAVRLLGRRNLASLMGPRALVRRDFLVATGVTLLTGGLLVAFWSRHFQAVPGLEPGFWLFLLPLALGGIAVQTLAEELVFRGWLMQQLAARFRRPVIWMGLPALVFAALHYDPGNGQNAMTLVLAVGVLGLVMGDLTRRTGSLGAAWGFHFANNCMALLVLTTGANLSGLALWRTPYGADDPALFFTLLADVGAAVFAWALIVRLIAPRPAA